VSGWLLLLSLPPASGADWRLVDQTGDCKVYVDDSQDVYHGKATCLWADVPAARIIDALEDPEHATAFFSNVKISRVVSTQGPEKRVFQVHKFPVGSDRETTKTLKDVAIDNGMRFEWKLVDDPPAPTEGRVTLEADAGYWQIRQGAEGAEVEFFMAYAPGGFLGVFPANKFMADGMVKTLGELRAEASK